MALSSSEERSTVPFLREGSQAQDLGLFSFALQMIRKGRKGRAAVVSTALSPLAPLLSKSCTSCSPWEW